MLVSMGASALLVHLILGGFLEMEMLPFVALTALWILQCCLIYCWVIDLRQDVFVFFVLFVC